MFDHVFPQDETYNVLNIMCTYMMSPSFTFHYKDEDSEHPLTKPLHALLNRGKVYLSSLPSNELRITFTQANNAYPISHLTIEQILSRGDDALDRLATYMFIINTIEKELEIVNHLEKDFLEKSLILKTFPELKPFFDKDNLLSINAPNIKLQKQWIEYKEHAINYHPLWKANYYDVPNDAFLKKFIDYCKLHPNKKNAIGIDYFRFGLKKFFTEYSRKAYWYGTKFNWKLADQPVPQGTPATVHGRVPSDLDIFGVLFDRVEFYWKYEERDEEGTATRKSSKKPKNISRINSFEIEEIVPLTDNMRIRGDFIATRYLHSERDIDKKAFTHLDGAIKLYDRETYNIRFSQNIPKEIKANHYVKLFRIDGTIENNEWAELVSSFFIRNELVKEYLESAKVKA
jgi:hypothetical protein